MYVEDCFEWGLDFYDEIKDWNYRLILSDVKLGSSLRNPECMCGILQQQEMQWYLHVSHT